MSLLCFAQIKQDFSLEAREDSKESQGEVTVSLRDFQIPPVFTTLFLLPTPDNFQDREEQQSVLIELPSS